MTRARPMLANFTWTFIGNSFYAACQWAMLAAVAKIGTPAMVGQFALAQAIAIPTYSFSNLQLRSIQVTDATGRHGAGTYLALRYVTTALAMCVIAAIALACGYRRETAGIVLVFGVAKAVESVSDILHGQLQKHERMDRVAISLALKGGLSLAAMVAGVHATHSVLWGCVAMTGAWIAVLLTYDRRAVSDVVAMARANLADGGWRVLRPAWDTAAIKGLARYAAPLAFAYLLVMLGPNIPRYSLEKFHGETTLGLYAALHHLTLVGYQIVGAMGQAASPRIARLFAERNAAAVRRWVAILAIIGGALGLIAVAVSVLAGREVLTIIYRPEYAAATGTFVVLIVASAFFWVGTGFGFALTAMQAFRVQIPPHAINVVLTMVLSLVTIPRGGLAAAAWIQLSGSALLCLAFGWITVRVLKRMSAQQSPSQAAKQQPAAGMTATG